MKDELKYFYMDVANRTSQLSHALRLKVGAVIVKDDDILSFSWNGTPYGFDNICEYTNEKGEIVTKEDTVHAEANCILKSAKLGKSVKGATMFITHNPCVNCAIMIIQSGISCVYYQEQYRIGKGIEYLEKAGIEVKQLKKYVDN